jgi:hypothetical protein
MKFPILVAACAVLAACGTPAPTHWTKAGATDRDFELDFATCRNRSERLPEPPRAQGLHQMPREMPGTGMHPDFIEACLRERGWERQ